MRTPTLLAACAAIGFALHPDPIVVGVLDRPGCDAPSVLGARRLFARGATGWTALDAPSASEPQQRHSWTVAFDGKDLGSITTIDTGFRSAYAWTFSRDHREVIATGATPPHVRNTSRSFVDFCGDTPIDRPLVLVSTQHFRDPDDWKPFSPDTSYQRAVFGAFHAQVDSAVTCPGGGEHTAGWHFGPADLRFLKSYRDQRGDRLVAVHLDPARNNCDGPRGDDWATYWIRIAGDTAVLGHNLELLDAGDYDNDGVSEVIFWHSAEDEDGYTLAFDHLRRSVNFWWKYH